MSAAGSSAGLGLMAAATWGASDFVGGMGARRSSALLVAASGQAVSLLALLAFSLGIGLAVPAAHYLLYAALGGFEGALALALFYRALAMGAMGLTAALTGLLTALVPTVYSLLRYGLPAPLTAAGLAAGCAAIWLITHRPSAKDAAAQNTATPPAALLMGALAGLGFGSQLILFEMAGAGGILWIVTAARAAGIAALVLVLLLMPPKRPWRGFWRAGILSGALDTVGILFYIRAAQLGRLDVAAVVCSLYPAGTILLAALMLRERPTRRQMAGIALALAAVALLSV
jgi:drug/metabolite transporter (DMT)-like permease